MYVNLTLLVTEPIQCGLYEFRCKNGRCIDNLKTCDDWDDCGDGSDEADCGKCRFHKHIGLMLRAQRLRGSASDCRLREPEFESCAAVLKPWASFFTLHCSSSLS